MATLTQPTQAMNELLVRSGSMNRDESWGATRELAKALELPLRKGIMSGDILFDIYERITLANGASPEFPLDFLAPGTEKDFNAYTIPNHGTLPQRNIEGDYVMVPTYEVGNAIDWLLKYSRDARWDIVNRAMAVLMSGFTKKSNDDGWHTLLAAGLDRNIMVYDADANAGQFTKRLISLMQIVMRRNGGGNSTSTNRGKLTDVFVSPEAKEDMRNWGVDIADEFTRRDIFLAADGTLTRLFGVNLHDIDELGEGQEYQTYFTGALSGSLQGSDVELVVGLDLSNRDSFVSPVRSEVEIFEDDSMHRQRRTGLYGWMEQGFAVLDNRRVILGSL